MYCRLIAAQSSVQEVARVGEIKLKTKITRPEEQSYVTFLKTNKRYREGLVHINVLNQVGDGLMYFVFLSSLDWLQFLGLAVAANLGITILEQTLGSVLTIPISRWLDTQDKEIRIR